MEPQNEKLCEARNHCSLGDNAAQILISKGFMQMQGKFGRGFSFSGGGKFR